MEPVIKVTAADADRFAKATQITHNKTGQSGLARDVRGEVVGTYAKVGKSWVVVWDGRLACVARTQRGAIQALDYFASVNRA